MIFTCGNVNKSCKWILINENIKLKASINQMYFYKI